MRDIIKEKLKETDLIKKEITQQWDQCASKYMDRMGYSLSDDLRQTWKDILTEEMESKTKCQVLDIGTGPGFLATLFAEMGHKCTGIDISHEMIKIAKLEAEKKGIKCTFSQGDAESLPFESKSFDIVVNRHVLWTLTHPGKAMREWVRVLRPGGKVIIFEGDWVCRERNITDNLRNFMGRCIISFTKKRFGSNHRRSSRELDKYLPLRDVSKAKIIALMEGAGIDKITTPSIEKLLEKDMKARPLGYRLIYNKNRYMVVGQKELV